jgi:hypothetical protein
MEQPKKLLRSNNPQRRAMIAMAFKAVMFLVWGRGTGKSFFIAWFMIQVVRRMPGSKWTFLGPTYAKLQFDILPGIVGALERFGYTEDIDFFVSKKPPKKWGWKMPYEAPKKFDYSIIFYHPKRCTIFQMACQDRNSSRGVNTDGIIIDEGLLINYKKMESDLFPTKRGNEDRAWSKDPLHHGMLVCTSMPFTTEGQWILDKQLQAATDKTLYYDEANCFENIGYGITKKYIKDQQKIMTPLIFDIEMLNMRKRQIDGGFYPRFNDQVHCYSDSYAYDVIDSTTFDYSKKIEVYSKFDRDCDTFRPLEIVVDWGASINSMWIGQEINGIDSPIFRFLKTLFVKSPDILHHLAVKFCDYYQYQIKKEVLFWYDPTGNHAQANSKLTNAQEFAKVLESRGWIVRYMSTGAEPPMEAKYHFIAKVHSEVDPRLVKLRYNQNNCKDGIISIQQAPVIQGEKGFKKDKRSEGKTTVLQEHATHFSDGHDIIVYGKYRHLIHTHDMFVDNMYI